MNDSEGIVHDSRSVEALTRNLRIGKRNVSDSEGIIFDSLYGIGNNKIIKLNSLVKPKSPAEISAGLFINMLFQIIIEQDLG